MKLFLVCEQPGPTAKRFFTLRDRGMRCVNGAFNHAIFDNEEVAKDYIKKEKKKCRGLLNDLLIIPMTLGEIK